MFELPTRPVLSALRAVNNTVCMTHVNNGDGEKEGGTDGGRGGGVGEFLYPDPYNFLNPNPSYPL